MLFHPIEDQHFYDIKFQGISAEFRFKSIHSLKLFTTW